jgi:aspartyl-tRNA(Asn)/glutamyl-tRNA(Gln) amidotransferase subunit C
MKREDIEHLARLSRIGITDVEAEALAKDVTSVLNYVSEIEDITGSTATEKQVGALHSVMRPDGEPTPGDTYTEVLLDAAPERVGRYIQVKKIIDDKA